MLGQFETCCGSVESTKVDFARVVLVGGGQMDEVCASCGACRGGRRPPARIWAQTGDHPVSKGSHVSVRRFVPNAALVAGVVFGFPLAGMVAGMTVAITAAKVPSESSLVVGASLIGLVIGVGAAWLVDRAFFNKHTPQIVAILPETP